MAETEPQPSSESIALLQYEWDLLKTVTEITKSILSILDLEQLLSAALELIQDHFIYFYVHLYLLDDSKNWAVLHAGTGEVGRILLEHKYKVEISDLTLIGKCVKNRILYIIADADTSPISFRNPLIPNACSAVALPLIARDKIIGVLEIQDIGYDTFSSKDILVLQIIADHIAIAVDNARLFGELQGKRA